MRYSILSVGHARRRLLCRVHSERLLVDCTTAASLLNRTEPPAPDGGAMHDTGWAQLPALARTTAYCGTVLVEYSIFSLTNWSCCRSLRELMAVVRHSRDATVPKPKKISCSGSRRNHNNGGTNCALSMRETLLYYDVIGELLTKVRWFYDVE